MRASLTIIRYKKRFIPFALLAMAIHRFPLWFNKKITFWKLLGCGRNGSFDKNPDWQQWGIMTVRSVESGSQEPGVGSQEPGVGSQESGVGSTESEVQSSKLQTPNSELHKLYGNFIARWLRFFGCETWTVILTPIEGHGLWDGKKVFGELPPKSTYEGPIAILTRATIRISKLQSFWKHVAGVASKMDGSKGFITSIGIGEIPWVKQATFSIWESKEDMKNFAYQMKEHKEVIVKTRTEKWYSEDMFVRFKILGSNGTIKGINPLNGKL